MIEDGDRVQLVTLYARVLLQLAQNPRISQETLARRLDVTMRTAQRHLTLLEDQGYISVDRDRKPFQYSVDWTRQCPFFPWMRVIMFHPDLKESVERFSDAAAHAYANPDGTRPSADDAIKRSIQPELQPTHVR